jgi:hypothetical protein
VRRAIAVAVGLVVAFALGIALGEALSDGSEPGGTQSLVRTLNPLPLAPAALRTVTVTTESHR